MLEMEIRRADVVAVVYAVDDEDTLFSVTDYWLPFIEKTLGENHKTPIILVGNKVCRFLTASKDLQYCAKCQRHRVHTLRIRLI